MDITPLIKEGSQIIQSYSPGQFRIGGRLYKGPVIVFPDRVEPWNFSADMVALSVDDFQEIFKHTDVVDVVLFGCGAQMVFMPPEIRQAFSRHGMTIETMDSGAACRTYNVLLAEGRRVAVALVPV